MIYAYGDDGADEKRERVIAVAVVAGNEEWWQDIEDQWVVRCGGIPFHATDCESDHGDYKSTPHTENKAMYRDLTGILAASKVGGIGIAIDLTAQKKILPQSLLDSRSSSSFSRVREDSVNPSHNPLGPLHSRGDQRIGARTRAAVVQIFGALQMAGNEYARDDA